MKRVQRYAPKLFEYDMGPDEAGMVESDDGEWVRFDDVPSWAMLMDILDAVYPASVFTGVSGDPGPLIIVKLREIDALRKGK